MKKAFYFIFAMSALSLSLVSCLSDDKNNNLPATEQKIQSNKNKPEKEAAFYEVESVVVDYKSAEEKKVLLDELNTYYLNNLYNESDFDSRYQVAGSSIDDYKEKKKLVLKFVRVNLDGMNFDQLAAFIGAYPLDYKTNTEEKKEKLLHQCVGGTNDSKTLTLDRPTGLGSAAAYGKKVADFAAECLDGGGCIEICTAASSIQANENTIVFEKDADRSEYIEMVHRTKEMVAKKLRDFNSKF